MDRQNRGNNGGGANRRNWWGIGAGVAAGAAAAAAVVGTIYYSTRSLEGQQQSQENQGPPNNRSPRENNSSSSTQRCQSTERSTFNLSSIISSIMNRVGMLPPQFESISRAEVPTNPSLTNLNSLLDDIYVRYVALKTEDFEIYFGVFEELFRQLQEKMKQVDPYYNKYSSRKQFAGSHFDRLRIKKPDEFDMDIVIGLPVNFDVNPNDDNDITLEHKSPGYVQLKAGTQFKRLPVRDGAEWLINKTAYEWKDDRDYLLRDKFINWFKSVVNRALNCFVSGSDGKPRIVVNNVEYSISKTESGPAMIFIIENRNRGFKLDIDFVPALKFPQSRWPICRGYRSVPRGCDKEDFMVVPKPNKAALNTFDESRSWRIAMHDQEKQLLYNLHNLKPTLRLIKKMRDALGLDKISSYYIKTIFFHEVVKRNDPEFWRQARGTLFNIMVKKLYQYVLLGNIPYFWNEENNLIGAVKKEILSEYARKLHALIRVLDNPCQYKSVAKYLLTTEEFNDYNNRFLHI